MPTPLSVASRRVNVKARFTLFDRWEAKAVLADGSIVTQLFIRCTSACWRSLPEARDQKWGIRELDGFVTAWKIQD